MNPKLKKIAIAIGLVIVILLSIPLGRFLIEKVRAFPNSILSFSPATKLVGNDQSFTLDAMIDPRTNQITAVSVRATFDPTKFRLDSISTTGSPFSVILLQAAINNTAGTAAIDVGVPPGSPTVPVTALSKIATFSFHSLAATTNSSIAFTTSSMAAALGEGATDVITQRNPASVTVDATAPTGGSITYTNGYFKVTSVGLTVSDGTDSVAGINTGSRIVQRKSAALSGTTCGTYGAWGTISPTGTYPNLTDSSAVNGNCYQYQYLVSDSVGNQAAYTSANTAKVDTAAPVVAQITAVASPTNDSTPNYVFSSTEAGTIAYGGDCSSGTTTAVSGNNTITFNTLSSATHGNCTIRVTDAAGNQSAILNVNSFTVDATAPTITSVTSTKTNGSYGVGAIIDIAVTFSEAVTSTGVVTVTLDTSRSCSFTASNTANGTCNYTVQSGDSSADLTTTSISGTIKDQLVNSMTNFSPAANLGANKNIVISAVSPVLAQVTAVSSIARDTTPNYTFSSSKAGAITYAGDCSSTTTAAVSGNNTITLNALSVGTHANCTITVTDPSGNASAPLSLGSFGVTYPGDLNTDRAVNLFDYNLLASNYGNATCGNAGDVNGDCSVNLFDYNTLLEDYGKSF